MDTISSTEFRKRFASLEQPVLVTVNGHSLGIWAPVQLAPGQSQIVDIERSDLLGKPVMPALHFGSVSAPTFRPVPKPTRRK